MILAEQIKERLKDKMIEFYQHSSKRIYISINPEDLKEITKIFYKELNLRFCTATGIDTRRGFELLYHFSFDKTGEIYSLRLLIEDKKNPQIDSLTSIFPAAEWIEREMWELLGINFIGHTNLKHLLLIDEWPEGKYPLRHEHES